MCLTFKLPWTNSNSWEMSTIGHPLADFVNLITPYTTAQIPFSEQTGRSNPAFRGGHPGLPTKQQVTSWYSAVAGWDPTSNIGWGEAFSIYKGCIIMQGIAARYAMRVASSANAKTYAVLMKPYAEIGWMMIESLIEEQEEKDAKAKI
jgi:aminoglycoside phosphotransferase (APT) family kinase protein